MILDKPDQVDVSRKNYHCTLCRALRTLELYCARLPLIKTEGNIILVPFIEHFKTFLSIFFCDLNFKMISLVLSSWIFWGFMLKPSELFFHFWQTRFHFDKLIPSLLLVHGSDKLFENLRTKSPYENLWQNLQFFDIRNFGYFGIVIKLHSFLFRWRGGYFVIAVSFLVENLP